MDQTPLASIFSQLEKDVAEDYKILVLRLKPKAYKGLTVSGYLETFYLPTTIPDIIKEIGFKYGGGTYQVKIVDTQGQSVKTKTFEIAGRPLPPNPPVIPELKKPRKAQKLVVAKLEKLAADARNEYELWGTTHPGQDPVTNPLADALWNLERTLQRVISIKKAEKTAKPR